MYALTQEEGGMTCSSEPEEHGALNQSHNLFHCSQPIRLYYFIALNQSECIISNMSSPPPPDLHDSPSVGGWRTRS